MTCPSDLTQGTNYAVPVERPRLINILLVLCVMAALHAAKIVNTI